MITKGDRVSHRNDKEQFGAGTVLEINPSKKTALVEWDDHAVKRSTQRLSVTQTHVSLSSLRPLRPKMG